MSKEAEFIYDLLEEAIAVNRCAPLILKIIVEEGRKCEDGWCHISYREWEERQITVWTLWKVLKWAKKKKLIQTKQEPPRDTIKGGGRGKKRTAYKLCIT